MKEKMKVHKALSELKMLGKRIETDLKNSTYVKTMKGQQSIVDGMTIEDCRQTLKSNLQSITDKIKRYNALKKALMLSNAVTPLEVNGVAMQVAEAIAMKKYGLDFKERLLKSMKLQYAQAEEIARRNESSVEESANQMVISLFGANDKNKAFTADMEQTKKSYILANTVSLINPNNLKNEIDLLQNEIELFTSEVDSALSISNALTDIEFEY